MDDNRACGNDGVMGKTLTLAVILLGTLAPSLRGQSTLFYIEAQAVGAYSSSGRELQPFSLTPEDSMQKPGIGFDLIHRVSGKSRDLGVLAVQGRLVYDERSRTSLEPQLYNASFRYKARFADIWAGHARPALGISAALDSHALLLPAPPMLGFGFDRDWGVGAQKSFSWGDAAVSLTTGSGMPLRFEGNFLLAARVSRGVAVRDNYSVGFSLSHGNILETMGYTVMRPEPVSWTSAGLDLTHFWRNLENRGEFLAGSRAGHGMFFLLWRAGLSLLDENRLKIEAQPAFWKTGGELQYSLASGLSCLINADWTARAMILNDRMRGDTRFVFQLYYYKRL
jgi:hypothetical protein